MLDAFAKTGMTSLDQLLNYNRFERTHCYLELCNIWLCDFTCYPNSSLVHRFLPEGKVSLGVEVDLLR